jgi:hypothetical protein
VDYDMENDNNDDKGEKGDDEKEYDDNEWW